MKSLILGAAAFLFEIVVVLLLVSSDYAADQTVREHEMIHSEMGASAAAAVSERADDWYQRWIADTGIAASVRASMPTEEEKEASRGLEHSFDLFFDYGSSRIEAFLDVLYWALRRMALFIIWLPIMAPVFFMAVGDGLLRRKVKMQTFAFSSPLIQEWAGSIAILASFGILILFFLPFAVPPMAAPALLGIAALFIGICFSNVRKRI